MKTTKPISTISYNTDAYFELKMNELLKAGIISFWAFIKHDGEVNDEVRDGKDHIHAYIEPAKSIQTEDLRKMLQEIDFTKPNKPLGCMPFNSSKFQDWYLYSIHDLDYLASKGLVKQFYYSLEDVKTSDEDYLYYKVRSIDTTDRTPIKKIKEAVKVGMSWPEMVEKGVVPVAQIHQYSLAYQALIESKKDKQMDDNGR